MGELIGFFVVEIWLPIIKYGYILWASIMGSMMIAQLVWTAWRWINDAEQEEEYNGIEKEARRRVVFGDMFNLTEKKYGFPFNGFPFDVQRHRTGDFSFNILFLVDFVGFVVILLWPLVIAYGICCTMLHLARGSIRLTKIVKRHHHDDRYTRK